jgi:uncharacterized membrane protein
MTESPRFQTPLRLSAAGFLLLLLLLFARLYRHGGNEQLMVLVLLLKVVGLLASFVLVLGTLKAPIFKRFCPRNPWFDCQRVIDSPAGKIFGLIHTADLGVLYFSSTLLVLVFGAFTPGFYYQVLLLGALNLLTLPYTLFSVAYQVFRVRRGCALCLIVQLVFWLEFWQFHPFLFSTAPDIRLDAGWLAPALLGLAIPVCAWPLLRYLLEKAYAAPGATTDAK